MGGYFYEDHKTSSVKVEEKPFILEDGDKIEIEIKIDLSSMPKYADIPFPKNFKAESRVHDPRIETFFFDDNGNYVYSEVVGHQLKIKTEPQIEVIHGIPILFRREVVAQYTTDKKLTMPKVAYSKTLIRERTSVWLVDVCSVDRFFVAFDTCRAQDGTKLHQIEIEYATKLIDPNRISTILGSMASLTNILTSTFKDFSPVVGTTTKYDWINNTKEITGWRRFFNLGF